VASCEPHTFFNKLALVLGTVLEQHLAHGHRPARLRLPITAGIMMANSDFDQNQDINHLPPGVVRLSTRAAISTQDAPRPA
jgi:hypothetical protein